MDFERNSCVGEFDPNRVVEFESIFASRWGYTIKFPASFVELQKRCHGGVPDLKSFRDRTGNERVLCRYLNFLREKDVAGEFQATWRSSRFDIRLEYSI